MRNLMRIHMLQRRLLLIQRESNQTILWQAPNELECAEQVHDSEDGTVEEAAVLDQTQDTLAHQISGGAFTSRRPLQTALPMNPVPGRM